MREPDPHSKNVGNQPNFRSGKIMKTLHKIAAISITAIALTAMTGCSNMSTRDKNTAIGATVGAVGGAILTGGSGIGTAGGAAVGGVIGHQIGR
jgi:osmotically inducible lipoprotein OsmB